MIGTYKDYVPTNAMDNASLNHKLKGFALGTHFAEVRSQDGNIRVQQDTALPIVDCTL